MNAKLCKAIRRMVRDASKPGTKARILLAKPVRCIRNGKPVEKVIAVNGQETDRGAYRRLKRACEENPEVLEHVKATARYLRLLDEEKASGGPTFEHGSP